MRAARRSSMTTCARSARGSCVKRTFQRTIYRPGELVQCDLWEPQDAGPGRPRADAPRLRGDRGAVLVAGDGRRADLLQGGSGHPLGPGPLLGRGSARCRRSWSGIARARSRRRRPPDRRVRGLLRAARCRLGDPRGRRRAGQGRCLSARIASCAPTSSRAGSFANPLDFQLQLDAWCEKVNQRVHRSVRAVPAERLIEERARMRPLPAASAGHATGGRWCVSRSSRYLRIDRNDYSIDPALRRAPRRGPRLPDARSRRSCWTPASSPCRHRRTLRAAA